MKLALEIPIPHWNDFIDWEDFHYTLVHLVLHSRKYRELYQSLNDKRDLWMDNSFNEIRDITTMDDILRGIDLINPTHVVMLESVEPKRNLVLAEKTKVELLKHGLGHIKTIACWRGTQWEMQTLKQMVDLVALPYDSNRHYGVSFSQARHHHFFGFRSIDEISRLKPMSLDTSAPIRAAYMGIDLRERKRRPKNLIPFDLNMTLTLEQVQLATDMIHAIKEAGRE